MQQGIQCNKCGLGNPFGSKFCSHCGAKLQYQCPRCNGLLEPGLKFCPACGMALDWGGGVNQEPKPPIIREFPKPEMLPSTESNEVKIPAASPASQPAETVQKEKSKPKKKANIWLIVLIVIVLLIAALFIVDMFSQGTLSASLLQSSTSTLASTPVRSSGTVAITAQSLYAAYAMNRTAAQMLYDDQKIKVSGFIRSTGISAGDAPFVNLIGGIDTIGVYCAFDKQNQSQIAQLKPGNTVTIQGICDGYYGTDVRLNQCVLFN